MTTKHRNLVLIDRLQESIRISFIRIMLFSIICVVSPLILHFSREPLATALFILVFLSSFALWLITAAEILRFNRHLKRLQ